MTHRQPTPPTGKPDCFGTAHDPALALCQECPVQRTCQHESARWADLPSLSEQLHTAWHSTYRPDVEPDSAASLFAALWEQHYGDDFFFRDPNAGFTTKQREYRRKALLSVERAAATCKEHGLDLATFIVAQMDTFAVMKKRGDQPWLRKAKTFPPNWLSGKGALNRYRVYTEIAYRQTRRDTADALDHRTVLGQLRETLAADTEAVGMEFCTVWRTVGTTTWEAAIAAVNPSDDWRAVSEGGTAETHRVRQRFRELRRKYGDERLAQELRLATLRAAFAIAQDTQHRLPDRIGCAKWSWESFARLLARVAGPMPTVTDRPSVPAGLGGHLWGAHDAQPRTGDVTRYGEN